MNIKDLVEYSRLEDIRVGDIVVNQGNHRRKGWYGEVVSIHKRTIVVQYHNEEALREARLYSDDLSTDGKRIYANRTIVRHFKKVGCMSLETKKGYIVWSPQASGNPRVVHGDLDAAKNEAERLAGENPGKDFYVAKLWTVSTTRTVKTISVN